MTDTQPRVAFLGLGIMGSGMAANLIEAGFPVTVWNRTAAKAAPLVEQGATQAGSPAEAAADADVIISIVGEDTASRAVWTGPEGVLAGSPKAGAIAIESTTISLQWVTQLHQTLTDAGLRFIDCPVTGGRGGAENGTLMLLVGAEEATLAEAQPVLDAYSQKTVLFGPPGAGTTFKLLYNMMGASHLAALSEGLLVAEKAGLKMDAVIEALHNGFVGSPGVKAFAERMANSDHDFVNFSAHWMRKDTDYAIKMYSELGQAAPMSAVAAQLYQLTLSRGWGDKNLSAIIEALRD